MQRVVDIQTDFAVGELDPKLRSRIDIKQYRSAVETGTNVVVQPQGGATRRPGSKYIHELPSAASPSSGIRLVPFEFSVTDSYMLAFVNNRMYVYRAGALITNINGSGNDYLTTTIASARLANLCWTQSADTLILVEEDMTPFKLVRGATSADWTISAISFDYVPKYAFTKTRTAIAQTLTMSATSGNATATAGGGTPFSAASVGQYIEDTTNFGRMLITAYVSATVVQGTIVVPFFSTAAIAANGWVYETGWVDAWSAGKGYPRSVTFHQGRLYFGGSKSLPSTIWGSRVGQYFDFKLLEGLDDEPIEATMETNTLNAIVDIYSGNDLQIFTTSGEFYVPQITNEPITPGNLIIRPQSRNGAKQGIRVQGLGSGTLYVQRQGKALNEFVYTDAERAYVSTNISLLSSHLLKSPSDMAVRRATSTDEGDRLLIVNSTDGSISCFTLLRSQNVIAPTSWTTDGSYKNVGVDVTTLYAVVKRSINGTDKYYVETFDNDVMLDCATTGTSLAAAVTGYSRLEAKSVSILADGVVLGNETVSSGAFTMDRAAVSSYQIGLAFTPTLKLMPPEPKLPSGNIQGMRKRIAEVNLVLYETQSIIVNGNEIVFRKLDDDILDSAVSSFTGVKRVQGLLGWGYSQQITLTQTLPLKMTVLGVDYRLLVGG